VRPWLVLAGVFGALGVGAGAFGAHGLKAVLSPEMLAVWETAARYHLIHAAALLGVAALAERQTPGVRVAGIAFSIGIVVFSGSLYSLALSGIGWLGAITPFGGLAFILGWLALAAAGWRAR
jgi:uncharacterized membrane protein YgdD (TMEM256/DUF423 family)